jgi:hypothetical protein
VIERRQVLMDNGIVDTGGNVRRTSDRHGACSQVKVADEQLIFTGSKYTLSFVLFMHRKYPETCATVFEISMGNNSF